jgi:hypothetical protein
LFIVPVHAFHTLTMSIQQNLFSLSCTLTTACTKTLKFNFARNYWRIRSWKRTSREMQVSDYVSSTCASIFVLFCVFFSFSSSINQVPNKPEDLKSFHEVLAPVIAIGNIFSLFPIAGIFRKNVDGLRFRIWYPITIYSIIVNFCLLAEFFLLFWFLYKSPFQFFMVGKWFLWIYFWSQKVYFIPKVLV